MLKLIAAGVALACALLLVAVDGSYYQQGGYGSAYNPYNSESRYPSLLPEAAAYAGGAPLPPNAKYNELVPYLRQFAAQYSPLNTLYLNSSNNKQYKVEWYSTGQPSRTVFSITVNLAALASRSVFSLNVGFTYTAFDPADFSTGLSRANTFTCRYENGAKSFLYRPNSFGGSTFDPLEYFYVNDLSFGILSSEMTFTDTTVTCSFTRINGVPACPSTTATDCHLNFWKPIENGRQVYFFAVFGPCSGGCLQDTDFSTNLAVQPNTTVTFFNYTSTTAVNC